MVSAKRLASALAASGPQIEFEPAIREADVLGLEPRAIQFLMLDHVAELVEDRIVLGEDQRVAQLRAEGVPLHRQGVAKVFMPYEKGGRHVMALERRLRLAQPLGAHPVEIDAGQIVGAADAKWIGQRIGGGWRHGVLFGL